MPLFLIPMFLIFGLVFLCLAGAGVPPRPPELESSSGMVRSGVLGGGGNSANLP
jgi:hypothetical protein